MTLISTVFVPMRFVLKFNAILFKIFMIFGVSAISTHSGSRMIKWDNFLVNEVLFHKTKIIKCWLST